MHLPEYRSSRPPKCHQKWFLLASILLSGLPSAFGDDAGVRAAASPPSRPYRFASGRASLQIPFEEDDGHIFVKLRVNDSGPLSFAVDTGAIRSVIDTERARALGLRVEGSQPVGGAGGIERAGTVKGVSIKLPGVELVDQTLWTLPLAAIAAVQGRPIDGILGYDLFRDLVIDIDYEHERLDVSDASGYVYRGPGESIPFTVIEDSIYVRGKVTSGTGLEAEGDFIVDTGGNVTLMLARSFVDEHRLAPPVESVIRAGGLGVGGTIKVTIGRVKKFQIGRFVVNEPVTAFVETGEIAERGKAGNIGARLLRRFRVVFDY
ncbi:MAG TPA: retroviral-like aspartic protease family protein, partial [Thermoanaerobaculia bacterium]|nr:retroviral-like aspartic protease family protein [Thermoanaerobaculia bacterium]